MASEPSLQLPAEVVDVILGLESQQEKQMLHGALQPMHTCTQPVTLRLVLLSLGAMRTFAAYAFRDDLRLDSVAFGWMHQGESDIPLP